VLAAVIVVLIVSVVWRLAAGGKTPHRATTPPTPTSATAVSVRPTETGQGEPTSPAASTLPGASHPVAPGGGVVTGTCPASALRLQLVPAERVADVDYDFALLRNVGDVACSVAGTLSVSYRDSAGQQVPLAASAVDRDEVRGSVTLSPRTPPEDVTPGAPPIAGATYLEVTLSARVRIGGRPCPAAELVTPATIDIVTAGGTISVANRLTPAPGVTAAPGSAAMLRACQGHLSVSLKPQG
jgi:hypothetical protein